MTTAPTALDADWLGACRRAVDSLTTLLAQVPTTIDRARETGTRGSGGDRTLLIDADAEEIVFSELETLSAQGFAFHVISEERGEIDFGSREVRVIVDPIDGSLNAKRRALHYALSVAVAHGETAADATFGYVYDLAAREEWWARRGEGAYLNGERLDPTLPERRTRAGKLEIVGIESADPRWVARSIDGLEACAHRLRAMGTVAGTLCQVAAARFDGMVTLSHCRGFDAAAGQLIVREAGGCVAFTAYPQPLAAPLDTEPRSALVAARSAEGLAELAGIVT